jgi:hypothetical protein
MRIDGLKANPPPLHDLFLSTLALTHSFSALLPPPRRLEWNRQAYQELTAKGLSGPIPESWSAMTSLETL